MGAKDLEWRICGTSGGASDGGRDLEAHFFSPDDGGEITEQRWWVECKGRIGTVEKSEVQEAVNNALAYDGLNRLVIATNTQFSNPTIDWVKAWQKKFVKPTVYLWDRAHLERFLSCHPEVVLRLFSEALSIDGRLQALESRFWNKLEFVAAKTLSDIWREREALSVTHMGLFDRYSFYFFILYTISNMNNYLIYPPSKLPLLKMKRGSRSRSGNPLDF